VVADLAASGPLQPEELMAKDNAKIPDGANTQWIGVPKKVLGLRSSQSPRGKVRVGGLLEFVAAESAEFACCIIHHRTAFGAHFEAIADDSAVPLCY
jgi:hypothetical protein